MVNIGGILNFITVHNLPINKAKIAVILGWWVIKNRTLFLELKDGTLKYVEQSILLLIRL